MPSMLSPLHTGAVLCAAMLMLAACDPRSPSVPQPKAETTLTAPQAEPVSPSAPSAEAAATTEPVLSGLSQYLGQYPSDGVNYLEQGALAERLKSLLGPRYPTLLANMRTVGPLSEEGALWSIVGLRPHEGGSEIGAVVIDPQRNVLRVLLVTAGVPSEFSDAQGAPVEWPPSVQTTLQNLGKNA